MQIDGGIGILKRHCHPQRENVVESNRKQDFQDYQVWKGNGMQRKFLYGNVT